MADDAYTGDVCYLDGWHRAVGDDGEPTDRLVLDDAGGYRVATDADTESWHDRKHQMFATVVMEDGSTIRVTADEADAVKSLLAERRG